MTFISAGFLLAGGVIFCLSCPGKRTGRPDYASSPDPDRLRMYQDEQRRRELQTERVQPKNRQNKKVQLLLDEVKQEKRPQEKPGQDQEQKLYSSPSKLPPKDIKDSYSLQEYV